MIKFVDFGAQLNGVHCFGFWDDEREEFEKIHGQEAFWSYERFLVSMYAELTRQSRYDLTLNEIVKNALEFTLARAYAELIPPKYRNLNGKPINE